MQDRFSQQAFNSNPHDSNYMSRPLIRPYKLKRNASIGCCGRSVRSTPRQDRFSRIRQKFQRFGDQELAHLIRKFNRLAVRGKLDQESFRKTLGVLGMEVFSFLSGRMFAVMDTNNDKFVTLDEYLRYLDVMVNGNQNEKHLQSFQILAIENRDQVSFKDWKYVIMQLQLMFSSISGQRWATPQTEMRKVFDYLDRDQKGYFTIQDYQRVLVEHPDLLSFLDITRSNLTGQIEQEFLKKQEDNQALQHERTVLKMYFDMLAILEEVQKGIDQLKELLSTLDIPSNYPKAEKLAASPPSRKVKDIKIQIERAIGNFQRESGPFVGAQHTERFSDDQEFNQREQNKSQQQRKREIELANKSAIQISDNSRLVEEDMTPRLTTYQKRESQSSPSSMIFSLFQLANRANKERVFGPFAILKRDEPRPAAGDADRKRSIFATNLKLRKQNPMNVNLNRVSSMVPGRTSPFQFEEKQNIERPERSMSHAVRFFDLSSQNKSGVSKKEDQPVNIGEVEIRMETDEESDRSDQINEEQGLPSQNIQAQLLRGASLHQSIQKYSPEPFKNNHNKFERKSSKRLTEVKKEIKPLTMGMSEQDAHTVEAMGQKLQKLKFMVHQKWTDYIDKYEEQKEKVEDGEQDEEIDRAELRNNIGKVIPKPRRKQDFVKDLPAKARFVHIGHQQFDLVIYILFGVKRSVDSLPELPLYQIRDNDFRIKCSYNLVTWLESDNEHNTCVFNDYAPQVFNEIRKIFGIPKEKYAAALNPAQIFGNFIGAQFESLSQQMSSGKSGSFFYYSANGQYLVKTISTTEYKFFKSILKNYYLHVRDYPSTLISRIYGLYKIRFSKKKGNKKFDIPFVIMNNLFCTPKKIDIRYDLKGSLTGRRTVFKGAPDFSIAMKDLNFRERNEVIDIGEPHASRVKQQIAVDSAFFAQLNIMDYSMLVGIHFSREMESEIISESNLQQIPMPALSQHLSPYKSSIKNRVSQARKQPLLPNHFKSLDGTREFIFGVIDIFTQYNLTKKLEYLFKKIKSGSKISCIPPKRYSKRFTEFMHSIIV